MKLLVKKDGELLDYLYNNLDMPKKRIKQYLTHGSIYVNNNRVKQYNYKVIAGMNIMIDTDNKHKKELPFQILFEDDHIIVVNKPSGLLTIATNKEKEKTLYHIVRDYLVSKDKNNKVFIVHRLDKDTSGIVLLAKDEKTKNQLQEKWNEYVKLREYIAVVYGDLKKKEGTITQYLLETKTNLVYLSKDKSGKETVLQMTKRLGAIVGINGGGFMDPDGSIQQRIDSACNQLSEQLHSLFNAEAKVAKQKIEETVLN